MLIEVVTHEDHLIGPQRIRDGVARSSDGQPKGWPMASTAARATASDCRGKGVTVVRESPKTEMFVDEGG